MNAIRSAAARGLRTAALLACLHDVPTTPPAVLHASVPHASAPLTGEAACGKGVLAVKTHS